MSPKTYNLTNIERKVLYRKYLNLGLSSEESNKKLGKVVKHLKSFSESLKMRNLTTHERDRKFKEEFYKICEEADK